MADAVPVNSTAEAPKKQTKAVSKEVVAEVRAQMAVPEVATDDTYKVKGGVAVGSHKAVREDF